MQYNPSNNPYRPEPPFLNIVLQRLFLAAIAATCMALVTHFITGRVQPQNAQHLKQENEQLQSAVLQLQQETQKQLQVQQDLQQQAQKILWAEEERKQKAQEIRQAEEEHRQKNSQRLLQDPETLLRGCKTTWVEYIDTNGDFAYNCTIYNHQNPLFRDYSMAYTPAPNGRVLYTIASKEVFKGSNVLEIRESWKTQCGVPIESDPAKKTTIYRCNGETIVNVSVTPSLINSAHETLFIMIVDEAAWNSRMLLKKTISPH